MTNLAGPILITGSRGFLGRHLAAELRRRQPATRLDLMDHRPAPGHLVCDMLDVTALTRHLRRLRPRLIFHLAGTTRPVGWEGLWRAHVEATIGLMKAVLALDGPRPRIWVVGSSGEYGDTSGRGPVAEDGETRPLSVYGSTKLSQTLAALSYRHRGLEIGVARMFNVLGPGMPEHLSLGSFAKQIVAVERGQAPPRLLVGNLGPRRDYCDIRDAARALALLADKGEPGQIYNICSGTAWSMGRLLKTMLGCSTARIEVVSDPGRRRAREAMESLGSHRRLTLATGWKPRLALERSLQDTLDWHRN